MNRMIAGSNTDSMLRGFDDLTRTLLDNALLSDTEGFLRRTAQSIGLGSKPIESLIFAKLENASPALNAALRDMVRARRNMSKRVEMTEGSGYLISRKDLSNPIAAKMAIDMGIAETSPDGVVRMRSNDIIAKEDTASLAALVNAIKSAPVIDASEPRLREVDGKIVGNGISNAQLAAIQTSPIINDKVKQGISIVKDAMENGNVIFIRNGKATKEIKSPLTGKKLKRYENGFRMTERDIAPFALNTSETGNIYIATFDISKARNEAIKLAGRDNLGPYGADFQTFYGDLTRYLNNLSDRENRVPTKELLGDAAKAAYLTEFFGGKDGTSAKYIRNFTLDRMVDMRLTGEKVSMSQTAYDLNKIGFMPAENIGDGKVFNSPDSGFTIISKNAGKHSLYAPTGERVGIYDTQAKAEAVANKKANPRVSDADIIEPVINPDHTVSPGAPAPDSPIRDIPTSGPEISWMDSEINYQPNVLPEVFPDMTPELLSELERISPTIAAIHIDRMRVGSYKGIDLQGGFFYPAIVDNLKKGIVWAFNSAGTARGVSKRASANGGLVKLVLMQEGNVIGNKTFARIWFHDLQENIASGKISKSDALVELNAIRKRHAELTGDEIASIKAAKIEGKNKKPRKVTGHTKEWTSLNEAERAITDIAQQTRGSTYFQKNADKEIISYQSLLSQKMTKMGFPDAVQIVRDIEEPAFKNVPRGAVVGILKFDSVAQGEKIKTAKEAGVPEHYSYGYVLHGKPIAKIRNFKIIDEAFPATRNRMLTQQNVNFPVRESIPSRISESHGTVNFMPETRVSGQQGSDTTQIATTVKTYGKAAGLFPKNTRILDVGAGLGLGADEMRKSGHSVDTVEPLSARWSSSTPRTFETIDQATEKYPGIVNFSVLNVVEPKLRDQIVDGIGQRMADGGTAYITARTRSDVEGAKNKRPANEAGGYWIKKSGGDVYQKGFSTPELVGYVQTRLGDQFKVKPASGLSGAAIEIKKFMPAIKFSAPENLPNGKVWRGENGYAIMQKEGGKFRVHSPIGLIGIAASYEAAEKMASKRNNK